MQLEDVNIPSEPEEASDEDEDYWYLEQETLIYKFFKYIRYKKKNCQIN